jgi:hypothetical protein
MDPKSHAVIDGPFDRDPDKSVWTTYYVDPKYKWWADVKSLAVTKPFVIILEDFVKIVGPDAELKIIARADKPEFHEGKLSGLTYQNDSLIGLNQLECTSPTQTRYSLRLIEWLHLMDPTTRALFLGTLARLAKMSKDRTDGKL